MTQAYFNFKASYRN